MYAYNLSLYLYSWFLQHGHVQYVPVYNNIQDLE